MSNSFIPLIDELRVREIAREQILLREAEIAAHAKRVEDELLPLKIGLQNALDGSFLELNKAARGLAEAEFEGFGKIPRLSRRCVITEKIDGTNAQVLILAKTEDGPCPGAVADVDEHLVYVGSRTRWITPKDDNYGFARWVEAHAKELVALLGPGRHFGEWWGCGIQRGYGLKEKRFSLFNTSKWTDQPLPEGVGVVPVLSEGVFCTDAVEGCLRALREHGSFAAPGFKNPEGVIVYHVAGNLMFKKTLEKDEEFKGGGR